jgi:hypothetical protein
METVMVDISDVVDLVIFNTEYEAHVINEANLVRERVNMSAREDRLDKDTTRHDDDEDKNNAEIRSSQSRAAMGESAIKSVGDAVSKNILDEESGKGKGHGKPGRRPRWSTSATWSCPTWSTRPTSLTLLCSIRSTKLASRCTKAGSST